MMPKDNNFGMRMSIDDKDKSESSVESGPTGASDEPWTHWDKST
jgi:hypothetical protein